MLCPSCRSEKLSVIDSRDTEDAVRRRRLCLTCSTRFTTYERLEQQIAIVIKKDGRRERFCRDKLVKGMLASCKNRPIDTTRIETVADAIEREINTLGAEDISSHYIGERVLAYLQDIDPVAYLRFASVHKSFPDLKAFEREIQKLERASQKVTQVEGVKPVQGT